MDIFSLEVTNAVFYMEVLQKCLQNCFPEIFKKLYI